MKTSFHTIKMIWSVIQANLSGWYVMLALLFFSIALSGCEQEELESFIPDMECTQEVTAIKVACGYGVYGDVWFINQKKEIFQPWDTYKDAQLTLPAGTQLVPGEKYKIGYLTTTPNNKYDDLIRCLAALPESKPITIACITPISATYL
jgi:hypothetical protein